MGSALVLLAASLASASADARPRQVALNRPAAVAPAPAKAAAVPDCSVWPPKEFPKIAALYDLKLEYDCRNQAIAHQRYVLMGQEHIKSIELAEKRDPVKLAEKDKWIIEVQGALAAHQRELDRWRDEIIRKLSMAPREASSESTVNVVNVSVSR